MLAALGQFVFDTSSALFDQLERQRSWRHARTDRFGAMAASQYTGPGDDRIRLSGRLIPEICGSYYSSIETLAEMAGTGDAYPFVKGSGDVLGQFTIEIIDERHTNLVDTGQARAVDFTIELSRVPEE
ncbi:oxidoreductase [Sphingomonas sp. S-NIH.Pt3_0716]|nr:oxidoreductase [Sphingomonas sp. S-NIH.Pt3_0716]